MRLIDRYFFGQQLWPALWAILALSGVGLLSQSLSGLELIVEQRQSAWVFIKVTLLAMPKMISLIVPLALFVAALLTLNRLHTEQEVIVCYAGGLSRWRVASPAMRLAVWVALVTLAVNLWVAPLASRNMRAELNAARADLAAALVREGQFTRPSPDLTVYAREVASGGVLRDLFINHRQASGDITYTAAEGRLTRRNGSPWLVMRNGATQKFDDKDRLTYGAFEQYPFDLSPFKVAGGAPTTKAADRYVRELLLPRPDDAWGQNNRSLMLAEFHSRIAGPLYNLTFMALALAAILGGHFSRLGYGRRILLFSVAALTLRILGFVAQEAAVGVPGVNALQYAIPLGGMLAGLLPFIAPGFRLRAPSLAGGRA